MSFPAIVAWFEFALCAALIAVAGTRLSRYGDVIAEKTGLSRSWIGIVLLATVTSLPELITGASSVTWAGAPDIALGDILGSCVFNLALLALLDFLNRDESVYSRASRGHILSAAFGVLLCGVIGFNLLFATTHAVPAFGHIGLYSPLLVVLYAVAMRTVFRYERAQLAAAVVEEAARYSDISLRHAVAQYAVAAIVVVAAGAWLPFVGEDLARAMSWQESFVGTLFIALATSLPEMAVTVSALRLGVPDMAISNLLGSNLFNCLLVAFDDVLYTRGPILAHVAPVHVMSVLSVAMMNGVVIVGLLYRPRTKLVRGVGWAGLFLFVAYLLNSFVLYLYG
jgi:cation:H+ antiporter